MSTAKQRLQMKVDAARQRARTQRQLGRTQTNISMRRAGRSVPRNPPAFFAAFSSEVKAIDLASAVTNFRGTGTPQLLLLNGVQTGAGFFNRVGSRIEMKNLHIRGQIVNVATATTVCCRLLVIYDRQPTGALPPVTDLIQARDQTGAATNSAFSEINLDNRDRFQIVRDLQYYCPPVTNTAGVLTNGPSFPASAKNDSDINEFIKLKGLTTHYKSSSNPTTIADIATGALYAVFVANIDASWAFQGGFRLRYQDS